MQSAEALTGLMPRPLLTRVINGERGNEVLGEWIVAFSPIGPGQMLADRGERPTEWAIALAVPRGRLFEAVFNLYLLYGVLMLSLAVTAAAGFLLSRRLLRPLTLLAGETEEIAKGHFGRRVEIRGEDEIADLGARFNAMATRLDETYRAIEEQKGRLEVEVKARTAELAREHDNLATIIESTAWQSGFDDLRKPYLSQRWPYPFIVIHPNDAKKKGIESGDLVQVYNDTVYVQMGQPQGVLDNDLNFNNLLKEGHIKVTDGQFVSVAIVSDEMREDVAMANFNFPGAPANSVVHAVPDPVTNNYRYKLGRGVLTKVGESPYKHSFTSMTLKPRPII